MFWRFFIIFLLLTQISPLPLELHTQLNQQSGLPPNSLVTVSIVIPPKNLELLQLLVENHTILNRTQVYELFIPTQQISDTLSYLSSFGLNASTILNVIIVKGRAGLIERALHGQFILTKVMGKPIYQFIGNPPFNAIVLGTNITSALLERPQYLINITQASAYNTIGIKDLQKAYNITPLLKEGINGSGVNIGILDFAGDPYIFQELKSFDEQNNIPNPPFFKIEPIGPYNPNDGIPSGWAMEISLDVEIAHAIAPEAGIILYVANINCPLPAAIAYIVSQDNVSVVSQSFGIPEIYFDLGYIPLSYLQSLIYEYWLGEVEGITFVAASGDYGGNGYNFFLSTLGNVNIPASIPYVLAVGGSTLYVNDNSSYQTAWAGESILGSTTGGYSSIFPAPTYQGINGFRLVPDVVADANPFSGVTITYYHNQTYIVGGTSLAAPIVSGIIALASQVHGKFGFINPLIYSLKGTKALVPVTLGYNTPYIANNSLNPVTGLGYINAGYFVNLVNKPSSYIDVATTNTTYLDNETIKVVAYLHNVIGTPKGYLYNGSKIMEKFTLAFNGTAWIGSFKASGSGVYEIIVTTNGISGFTYVTVGYQIEFILPSLAVYPIPEEIPVLLETFYVNGKLANASPTTTLYLYKVVNQTEFHLINEYNLTPGIIINITRFGITIKSSSAVLTGYLNFSNVSILEGIYLLELKGAFGFGEIVLGFYVVPYILPSVITEPEVISPGQNFTLVVFEEGFGTPNISISLVSEKGITIYSTNVNPININGQPVYIAEISLPKNIPTGYYNVIAKAIYSNGTFLSEGEGYTQIYITNSSLNVNVKVNPIAYENQTLKITASITYPNGTPVTLGTFSAIVFPSYLNYYYDQLSSNFVVQLKYQNGSWIGYFTVPNGIEANILGYSSYGISGTWNVIVEGISSDWYPTNTSTYLSWSTLNLIPTLYNTRIYVLPYVYVNYFNGTIAYGMYIEHAVIINHNATFVNSLINNLTVINGTAFLINSQVFHSQIISAKVYIMEENQTTKVVTMPIITQNKISHITRIDLILIELLTLIVSVAILIIMYRKIT